MSGRLRDGKKGTKETKEPQQETVYLPPLSVYTEWMALYLNQKGKRTAVLPDYTAQDLHAGKAYSTAKEYCTFSAAAGQIANRLQETDGEEKQFLVFQTEGAEADGMVPEILRAVLDADGKRAHLVTPFLEQLLFAEEADADVFPEALGREVGIHRDFSGVVLPGKLCLGELVLRVQFLHGLRDGCGGAFAAQSDRFFCHISRPPLPDGCAGR